jgi:cation:H+ antiporter
MIAGLIFLILGAESLVRGSAALALRLGMRPLLIGMTVVAFGTSMPEMVVSVQAALSDRGDISLGNIIGSNICNLGLILGLSALVRPMIVRSRTVMMDVPVMIISVILLILFLLSPGLTRPEGTVLLVCMVLFMVYTVLQARHDHFQIQSSDLGMGEIRHIPFIRLTVYILFSLIGLFFGARFLIHGAVGLARAWGVSEAVIGLTIVAVGTSLPELATSIIAAARKESDIAVGNVIGSNIFNGLAILGTASLIRPFQSVECSWWSLGVMLLLSVLCLPFLRSGFRLSRFEGLCLLIVYGVYIVFLPGLF